MRVVSHGTLINSTETLDLWLNAYEYHRDDEKRVEFEALHDGNLPMEYSRALFIHILLDRARAVVDLGNAFYALQRNLVVTPLPGDLPSPEPRIWLSPAAHVPLWEPLAGLPRPSARVGRSALLGLSGTLTGPCRSSGESR